MNYKIYNPYKFLAATAIAATLSVSLLSATVFAQDAPANRVKQDDIQLQKVDGPRRTGRTRPVDKTRAVRINDPKNPGAGQRSDAANTNASPPTIRKIDPEKVQQIRDRLRNERSMRIRDTRFQEERIKNIRRLVQIERIRELAEQNENKELLERASQLRDKEIQRHTRKLASLQHEGIERRKANRLQQVDTADSPQAQ